MPTSAGRSSRFVCFTTRGASGTGVAAVRTWGHHDGRGTDNQHGRGGKLAAPRRRVGPAQPARYRRAGGYPGGPARTRVSPPALPYPANRAYCPRLPAPGPSRTLPGTRRPAYCHGDVHEDNLLAEVTEDGACSLTGLLDPDNMHAGDPLMDFVPSTRSPCVVTRRKWPGCCPATASTYPGGRPANGPSPGARVSRSTASRSPWSLTTGTRASGRQANCPPSTVNCVSSWTSLRGQRGCYAGRAACRRPWRSDRRWPGRRPGREIRPGPG
jgi:hypothetical protein